MEAHGTMKARDGAGAGCAAALAALRATEIAPRVWRWTTFHPQWRDDVASLGLVGDDEFVLVDPLLPDQQVARARFWRTLEETATKHPLELAVVLTVYWHRRSACVIVSRYTHTAAATLWVHDD